MNTATKRPAMSDEEARLRAAIVKARDGIGCQTGDITGAALDAWVVLCEAVPADEHE